MSMVGKTLVKGHTLLFEGQALGRSHDRCGRGIGGCTCGERSEELPNRASRKRWHKQHKAEVIAKLQNLESEA
jgi:hypothetical protein